jgi:hypothetical protein
MSQKRTEIRQKSSRRGEPAFGGRNGYDWFGAGEKYASPKELLMMPGQNPEKAGKNRQATGNAVIVS